MSNEEKVGNPTPAEYNGVSVEHPRIREYGRNMAKQGIPKEQAAKLLGMPREVVDKIYKEEGN